MKNYIKLVLEALYHLLFFKRYTNIPRIIEISYGLLAWSNVCLILYLYVWKN